MEGYSLGKPEEEIDPFTQFVDDLKRNHFPDEVTNSGVIASSKYWYNSRTHQTELAVLVAPETDISDEEIFPRQFSGEPVNYLKVAMPERHLSDGT